MRGCSPGHVSSGRREVVLPANAGVIRNAATTRANSTGSPRDAGSSMVTDCQSRSVCGASSLLPQRSDGVGGLANVLGGVVDDADEADSADDGRVPVAVDDVVEFVFAQTVDVVDERFTGFF